MIGSNCMEWWRASQSIAVSANTENSNWKACEAAENEIVLAFPLCRKCFALVRNVSTRRRVEARCLDSVGSIISVSTVS